MQKLLRERLNRKIVMSLEQVGRCDDIIWGYPRELQDAYYPFMDRLHTEMRIHRIPFGEQDLEVALKDRRLDGLSFSDKLIGSRLAT